MTAGGVDPQIKADEYPQITQIENTSFLNLRNLRNLRMV
jgi:hypothetical protein